MTATHPGRLALAALLTTLLACTDTPGALGPDGEPQRVWKRWSEPSTWPDRRVPSAGSAVVIARGVNVLLDVSPPPLGELRVEGALRFGERDLALTARSIVVHGTLQVGTESDPFLHRAVITLTGSDDGSDPMGMGTKVLGVMPGGVLDLHGAPRLDWTRLAAHALAGSTELTLETKADWRPGDRLVVASTDFDPGQGEEVTVRAVSGSTVTLAEPLRHSHWGTVQTVAGQPVDQRAEVGLLTRNLSIRGDDPAGFGGHVMVMGGGTARIEGVELYQMGQKAKLARYPIHWHMVGEAPGQYARGNSIWKSFNRCITIHGTHRVRLEDNVCYDHLGHGYFLEDGVETGNTLQGNLGLRTRIPARGEMLLPSDDRPATFWITNPDNAVRGNVAAGSYGFGFWYALPEHPTGISTTSTVWPRRTRLLEFSDNVAHSNRRAGLQVDDGPKPDGTTETASYRPRENPAGESAAVLAEFRNFTAYKHIGQAVWLRGGYLRMTGAVLADNAIGVTFASYETQLRSSLVVGETENRGSPLPASFPIRGFEFYDGRVGAEGVVFANFQPAGARPASALGFKRANGFTFSPGNYATAVRFVNANPVYLENPRADRDGDKNAVALDTDGSVTGTPGHSVVANSPHLLTPACTYQSGWNAWVCPARYLAVTVRSEVESVAPLEVRRDDGATVALVGIPNNPRSAALSAVSGRRYALSFQTGAPLRPRIAVGRLGAADWVGISLPYRPGPLVVYRDGDLARPFVAAASEAEVLAGAGDRYFLDAARGILHLKVTARPGRDQATLYVDPR